MQTLQSGTQLQGGKYIIRQVLGQGGFGVTYLAEHTVLGANVAIKEFFFKQFCVRDLNTCHVSVASRTNLDIVNRFEEKFLKEARIIAKLNHPNITKIHDVFSENNTAYYVMDFIEGVNLADLIKLRGALPEAEALRYISQAAEALQYIHNQYLNHLDVKPANLMLRKSDNQVILIDFGMSKQYDSVSGNQTSTTPVGISHGYAPIEQYKAGGVKEFSPQSDIYALGATLYKLITGDTPPQPGEIIEDGLPNLPMSVSLETRETIEKAMSINKLDRHSNIREFLSMLTKNNGGFSEYDSTINIENAESYSIEEEPNDDTNIEEQDDLANAMLRQKQENEELEQQRIMKKLSKIEGIENMTYKDLVKDIEKGGKFIYFSYAISLILFSGKDNSNIFYLPSGELPISKGFPYLILSLLLGWWGIPWGPIYTLQCIWISFTGNDVTGDVMSQATSGTSFAKNDKGR